MVPVQPVLRFVHSSVRRAAPPALRTYAPFGWSPTSCIGAGLGTLQLIALCRLLTQRFQLDVPDPEAVTIFLGALPLVEGFVGEIHSRA